MFMIIFYYKSIASYSRYVLIVSNYDKIIFFVKTYNIMVGVKMGYTAQYYVEMYSLNKASYDSSML